MKNDFNEVKQLATSVAEKRTHVRNAFTKLLDTLSKPVADVKSDEPAIKALLYTKVTPGDQYNDGEKEEWYLRLKFKNDAEFELWWAKYHYPSDYLEKDGWTAPEHEKPSDLREMAKAIPSALQNIRDQLKEKTHGYDETVKLLEDMIAKLES